MDKMKKKVAKVMREYKSGKLKSSSGALLLMLHLRKQLKPQ